MKVKEIHTIYFLGIGGIGMSALAHYFLQQGKRVYGYDKTPSLITDALQEAGAEINFKDEWLINPFDIDLGVYTPAIPDELQLKDEMLQQEKYPVKKRAEVLALIADQYRELAVAGTHGKTSTSAMLAHIMHQTSKVNAFVGGIMSNYNANILLNNNAQYSVVEADEFDRSFMHLHPFATAITASDPDHLDIYGTEEEFLKTLKSFLTQTQHKVIACETVDPAVFPENVKVETYGFSYDADWQIVLEEDYAEQRRFGLTSPSKSEHIVPMALPGKHNVLNATAALALAVTGGIEIGEAIEAMATFKGIKRRFETLLETEEAAVIDDYAHHPTEINAAIEAARSFYPKRKLTVAFQPHLYSRTQDFINQFAESLSHADEVLLIDIYPARELPIDGVSSQKIVNIIGSEKARLITKSELVRLGREKEKELLLILGAGDIDRCAMEIKNSL